ncbi:MAG: phosphoribosylaminoimidazolesuccinocarboxamide synthase [Candidatus Melainabacteria bacterium]|nr:phosphoribosylaminoimidazolesuccinocarboxamide synthase [Candidatus Melainabacteria bacterium]
MSDLSKSPEGKPIYEGSVKRLWQSPDDADNLRFEFTDDYSIFDWGKMPDTITNKGKALAFLGAHFFETFGEAKFWQSLRESKYLKRFGGDWLKRRFSHPVYETLTTSGLPHHFKRLVNAGGTVDRTAIATTDKVYMEVVKANVPNPELRKMLNHELYFYPHVSDQSKVRQSSTAADGSVRRLVPLEIVFRFGMPEGSSLTSRLQKNPGYLRELGLPAVPTPGEWFPVPVIEFFTKLEPSDRLLSWTEASLMSGLSAQAFEDLLETTLYCALGLYHLFAEKGLELWDGKFEFVVEYPANGKPRILLADSIGPDELRLICRGHHLSKELIRQIYKDTPWTNALSKAKDLAKQRLEPDFKRICAEELGQTPAPLTVAEREIVDGLYGSLANLMAGTEVFPNQPTMDDFVNTLQTTFPQDKPDVGASGNRHAHRKSQPLRTAIHHTDKEISVKARGDNK